jgi:hypothetical protein
MAWIDPSLIASNLLEYEDIVVELATNPAMLLAAKQRVARWNSLVASGHFFADVDGDLAGVLKTAVCLTRKSGPEV